MITCFLWFFYFLPEHLYTFEAQQVPVICNEIKCAFKKFPCTVPGARIFKIWMYCTISHRKKKYCNKTRFARDWRNYSDKLHNLSKKTSVQIIESKTIPQKNALLRSCDTHATQTTALTKYSNEEDENEDGDHHDDDSSACCLVPRQAAWRVRRRSWRRWCFWEQRKKKMNNNNNNDQSSLWQCTRKT